MRGAYVSSGAFPSRRLDEILGLAVQWGLTQVELSSDIAHDPANVDLARNAGRHLKLMLHNYFPAPKEPFVLNLAAADRDILERSRDHCCAALELSAELEAPVFAAHAGFTVQPDPRQLGRRFASISVSHREEAYGIFVDSVGELSARGRRLGVRFIVENNVVAPFNSRDGRNPFLLLAESDEILRCAADVGSDFGVLMDVGHLKVSAQTLGFDAVGALRAVVPVVTAWHLSENDGSTDDNRPFDAAAWFLPYLDDKCPLTLEVYNTTEASIRQMMRLLDRSRTATGCLKH
jgi:sugar phosphate isomerase/epimerase